MPSTTALKFSTFARHIAGSFFLTKLATRRALGFTISFSLNRYSDYPGR